MTQVFFPAPLTATTRRRFVQGLAVAGAASLLWRNTSLAQAQQPAPAALSGNRFDLTIGPVPFNVTGRPRIATAVNGSVPAPTLRFREGDTVTINVTNKLAEPTSIHWHGLRLPADQDGVPGLTFHGIMPGETFTYRFPIKQGAAPTGITAIAACRSRPASTARSFSCRATRSLTATIANT